MSASQTPELMSELTSAAMDDVLSITPTTAQAENPEQVVTEDHPQQEVTKKKSRFRSGKKTQANYNPKKRTIEPGKSAALPAKIDGVKVKYLDSTAGYALEPQAMKMSEILPDTYILIDHVRKIKTRYGEQYIMFTNDHHAFWSNLRATNIINSGACDFATQYMIIANHPEQGFQYGVVNKSN